jgi:outer membrane protein
MRNLTMMLFATMLLVGSLASARADERIVFVNMEKVFEEFDKTKLADAQLKKQAREFAQERETMIQEANKLRDEFNELRSQGADEALSEEAREEKKASAEDALIKFREKEQEINEFNRLRAKQLEDQGKRMRENIVEEISSTITRYARNNGYIAVLDSSAQSMNAIDTVIYVDSRYDVTADIIALLNKTE